MWRNFAIAQECYDPLTSEDQKTTEKPRQRCLEDTTIEAAQEVLKNSPGGVLCVSTTNYRAGSVLWKNTLAAALPQTAVSGCGPFKAAPARRRSDREPLGLAARRHST